MFNTHFNFLKCKARIAYLRLFGGFGLNWQHGFLAQCLEGQMPGSVVPDQEGAKSIKSTCGGPLLATPAAVGMNLPASKLLRHIWACSTPGIALLPRLKQQKHILQHFAWTQYVLGMGTILGKGSNVRKRNVLQRWKLRIRSTGSVAWIPQSFKGSNSREAR